MHYWLVQLALLAGLLVFAGRLPALGSVEAALLAAVLAVATAQLTVTALTRTGAALAPIARRLLRLPATSPDA